MDQFNIKKDPTKSFKRPRSLIDVRYRKIQSLKFEDNLKRELDETSDLCFHGTPIWNAEQIIKSKNISAEVDRVGKKEDGLDISGYIYVSTMKNLWFTVKNHSDLLNFDYPAGCIFVIKPKDKIDIKTAETNNIIKNIDFATDPERLKAIITTPENIERVKNWVKESGIDIAEDIVMDYEDFINYVKGLRHNTEITNA